MGGRILLDHRLGLTPIRNDQATLSFLDYRSSGVVFHRGLNRRQSITELTPRRTTLFLLLRDFSGGVFQIPVVRRLVLITGRVLLGYGWQKTIGIDRSSRVVIVIRITLNLST